MLKILLIGIASAENYLSKCQKFRDTADEDNSFWDSFDNVQTYIGDYPSELSNIYAVQNSTVDPST